jgi:amino acid transporter
MCCPRRCYPHTRHGSPHQASLWISGVVAISIALAAVLQLDPAAQFYTWFAGTTTVGFVLLLIATSVAVLAFFAQDRRGNSLWRVRIAPALGLVGLAASLVLILANLKDLVGGSGVLGWVIVGLLVAAFAAGVVVGGRVSARTTTAG